MIVVKWSSGFEAEKRYICHVVMREFLGLDYSIELTGDRGEYKICFDSKSITFPDVLFSCPAGDWLKKKTFPKLPLRAREIGDLRFGKFYRNTVPVVYGLPYCIEHPLESKRFDIDLLGSIFFLLTRYEEVDAPSDDPFERYDYKNSIQFQEGILDRPIVNEYLEILKILLLQLSSRITFRTREYFFSLSHDVDVPFTFPNGWADTLKKASGDLIFRRSASLIVSRIAGKINHSISGSLKADPNNNFDFLLDLAAKFKTKSLFNFIPMPGTGVVDSTYFLSDPSVLAVLMKIHVKGSEIGFHPSYQSYNNYERTAEELALLNKTLYSLGIPPVMRGRQHYLRWSVAESWHIWNRLGLLEDGSVGYDGANGFRTGCCYKYSVFDVNRRQHLQLVEEPLIVMDINCNVNHVHNTILEDTHKFAGICRFFNGNFSLLYHNNYIISNQQKLQYATAIRDCAS